MHRYSLNIDTSLYSNAKYIIYYFSKRGREVTNLKLQKLLYFLEAIYMVISNKDNLFDEEFYASNLGPSNDAIYGKYKEFGKIPIMLDERINIPKENLKYIKILFELFGDYTAYDLVALSHCNGSPWCDIYRKYEDGDIPGDEIIDKLKTKKWFLEDVVDIEDDDYES